MAAKLLTRTETDVEDDGSNLDAPYGVASHVTIASASRRRPAVRLGHSPEQAISTQSVPTSPALPTAQSQSTPEPQPLPPDQSEPSPSPPCSRREVFEYPERMEIFSRDEPPFVQIRPVRPERGEELGPDQNEPMLNNDGSFNWTLERRELCIRLAEGISLARVARQYHRPVSLLRWLLTNRDFKAEVTRMREEVQKQIYEYGIAARIARVTSLNRRWELMHDVIDSRANAAIHNEELRESAPGSETGLLIIRHKMIGQGPNAREVIESQVDTELLAELRATEKQVAQELGQWTDKTELTVLPKAYIGVDLDRV